MKPRAVTGLGVASPIGIGRATFFEALSNPERPSAAAGYPTVFDASKYAGARLAEIPSFDASKYLGDKGLRSLDRLSKLLLVASRLALEDSALKTRGEWAASGSGDRPWPERVGIVVSNAYGSLEAITELDRVALLEDARYINPSRFPLTVSNSAAGYASIWEDLRALNVSVSDGNCGALDAVACADLLLDGLRADALLVGGAEAMSEALFVAFHRLGLGQAPTVEVEQAPFLGEGAALLVLETTEGARSRGRPIAAEVIGYGTSFSPPDREASLVHATPDALESAIRGALADARVAPADVDVVVSGLSGLPTFDEAELSAIRRVLGDQGCIAAPKSAVGETLGAGGAMSMAAAVGLLMGLARGPWVRGALRGAVRTALVTSLGYYGNASALVMRAASR